MHAMSQPLGLRWMVATAVWMGFTVVAVAADQPPSAARYSDEVVAKAESILNAAGLRRSGKTITATNTADISRAISGLTRDRRELRLVYQDWKKVADRVDAIRVELEQLNTQDGQYNLQLATLAGNDVTAHNRVVGLINATRAASRARISERDRIKEKELPEKRDALNKAEAAYAETVLAIRRGYRELHDQMAKSLQEDPVKIGLRVLAANFETPTEPTAGDILAALDKRIAKIEQEVFSENITLDVQGGSLYVNVSVGNKTTRMVVDSGATLVSLPATTAAELGIEVPADAKPMQLIMADGRTIGARSVTLARVRVGEFEAENVAAAVLDATAVGAEPLLGMSYLENFKFEIDSPGKTLKMLRVAAD